MKLRPLLLTLAVLAPASALVWWLGRPAPAATGSDPRVGQRVAEPAALASAARVTIKSSDKTLELVLADGGRWTLSGEPVLPADASRLTRLTGDLVTPKIERLVSTNPERLATFELGSSGLSYADSEGKTLLALDLGKTLEGGARLLRYADEQKAYAARLNLWLDAEPASWRDTALVAGLQASDIASISIGFPDTTGAAPVVVSRASATDPWTSPSTPAGHQVKSSAISTQTGNLPTLRYTNVAPNLDPGVVAARVFPREAILTAFDGRTVKLAFHRAPAPPAPPTPEVAEGEEPPPPPPAAPRPVYVEVTDSRPDAILAAAAKTHAFEVAEWIFTGLPAKPDDLFEPVPAPPGAAEPAAPSTEEAPAQAAISVTTPPLTVPMPEPAAEEPAP